jgi:hypothetical protein
MPLVKVNSPALAANLSFSMIRVTETSNIHIGSLPSTPSGNINIDVLANTVYYFNSNTTANVTFNLRGNSNTRLDAAMSNGDSISVAIALRHANPTGGRHVANVAIDGGYINTTRSNPDIAGGNIIYFAGNTAPTVLSSIGDSLELNLFGITVIKRAANSYTVLQSNTLFGLG